LAYSPNTLDKEKSIIFTRRPEDAISNWQQGKETGHKNSVGLIMNYQKTLEETYSH
jgi:hypothetical protein